MNLSIFVALILTVSSAYSWDAEDLEVFDTVEEVRENFYDLLGVPFNAEPKQIKQAFRKLSLTVHPDKSDAPDAEIKFRNLVAVFEILKDPLKRSKYNDVLENGLPDWKHPVYYYRRYKKMGLLEMSLILFIIITIGQYLVAWAAYFERKYTLEEFVSLRSKKLQKRQKKGKAVDADALKILPELVTNLPKPSVTGTLPVQICKLCWFLVVKAPPLTVTWIKEYVQRRKEREAEQEEESSEEEVYVPRERGPRRRKGFTLPEVKESNNEVKSKPEVLKVSPEKRPALNVGLWTDDDFLDLIRLMKKFPTGTQERWEKIGEAMRRLPSEVAHMAHKMKDNAFKPIAQQEEEEVVEEAPKKVKTKGGKLGEDVEDQSNWSQVQQKAFEQALAQYPKGSAIDRWEKIAKAVPGKTKEECIIRYKCLAELVKKKKQQIDESPS